MKINIEYIYGLIGLATWNAIWFTCSDVIPKTVTGNGLTISLIAILCLSAIRKKE